MRAFRLQLSVLLGLALIAAATIPDSADARGRGPRSRQCGSDSCGTCTAACNACTPADTGQAAEEADHVHCIFVLGTEDEALAGQMKAGGTRVRNLFKTPALKAKIATYTVLEGSQATPEAVTAACNAVPSAANDSIFFFYLGHGATDPKAGHTLLPLASRSGEGELKPGQGVARSGLIGILKAKDHRFVCFVTDSCSNVVDVTVVRPEEEEPAAVPPGEKAAIVSLMLENKGVLDINSSTYDPAKGIEERSWIVPEGGVMTVAFARLAQQYGMDKDQDRKLSWKKEFLPELAELTDELFQRVKKNPAVLAAQPQVLNQDHQTVQRFDHDGTGV